jgi:thioester reductase-like protein
MHRVLITGATGVIGSELVPLFVESGEFAVTLLIRAASAEHLQRRLADLYRYWGVDQGNPTWAVRLEVAAGDVCQPRLGLEESVYQRLAGEVTHLVHTAGNVRLNQTLEDARRDAVDSVRHVIALARLCQQRGQLRKLDAVSTVGVAGRFSGVVPEQPMEGPREFHNSYEAAKAEAETVLLQAAADGLPVSIHRPSMVVGRSDTGKVIRFQVFYYLCEFLTGRRTWGIVPQTGDARLDIIPVDYVARAIWLASQQKDAVGRIFHLCSGPEHAIPLDELSAILRQAAEKGGVSVPRLRQLPLSWFRRLVGVASCFLWGRSRRALRSLPYFLAYLDERQQFENRQSAEYFRQHGLELPDPTDYLEQLMRFAAARPS